MFGYFAGIISIFLVLPMTFMLVLSAIFGGEAYTQISAAPLGYSEGAIHYVGKGTTNFFDSVPSELGLVNQMVWGQGPTRLVTGTNFGIAVPGVLKYDLTVGATGDLVKWDRQTFSYFVLPQVGVTIGYGPGLALGLKTYAEVASEILPDFSLFANLGLGLTFVPGGGSQSFGAYVPLGLGLKYKARKE